MLGFFKKNKSIDIYAPAAGETLNIEAVPDELFAGKMIGDGIAMNPTSNIILSPCDGKILQIFPTNHAIGIKTKEGIEILIHIGIDTVELKGAGFKRLIEPGASVSAGDRLVEIDIDYIKRNAKSIITPIIITNMDAVKGIEKFEATDVKEKDVIMKVDLK